MTAAQPLFSTMPGPALGLLELSSVARGLVVADAMVKKALVRLVVAHPVTPGKFVVIVAGGEEEVRLSLDHGTALAQDQVVDRLYLAKADPQIAPALGGAMQPGEVESLGVVETFSIASAVLAADRAVKAAAVRLVQLRLARGLGGKAFFTLSGELHQLEAAVEAARSIIHDGMLYTTEIIPAPHPDLVEILLAQEPVPPIHG